MTSLELKSLIKMFKSSKSVKVDVKCSSTCAVMGFIGNDMQIAVEAVSARCCALLTDALNSRVWPRTADPGGVGWWLPVWREAASLGLCFLRVWAVPALEMSSVQVKVGPSREDFLLCV